MYEVWIRFCLKGAKKKILYNSSLNVVDEVVGVSRLVEAWADVTKSVNPKHRMDGWLKGLWTFS